MKRFFIYFVLVISIVITSCSTFKIKLEGNSEKVKTFENIGILNVYICPPDSPIFPLLDAGIYNGKFNDIYADIAMYHEKNADTISTYLGKQFEKYSGAKIVYGENLYSLFPADLKNQSNLKQYSLVLNNDNFPKIPYPKYALNFFNFSDNSSPESYFERLDFQNIRSVIKNICEYIKTDGLIISYISVPTISVGAFGISGNRLLKGRLFFFDKNGNHVCTGVMVSNQTSSSPDNFKHYELVFSDYYRLSDLLLRHLYLGEEPKDLNTINSSINNNTKSSGRIKK